MALVSLVSLQTAIAQLPSARQSGITIQGRVLDSNGTPVGGASVLIRTGGAGMEIKTGSDGKFTFFIRAGIYTLSAEKSGVHSADTSVQISSGEQTKQIELTIPGPDASSHTSPRAMTFADKPDFTVAGITDWTAAAGHGSDSTLRTSESLTRDAIALKPDKPGVGESSSSPSGDRDVEGGLRGALAESPGSFDANHQLGEFYCHAGEYRQSIPLLQAAFQIDPRRHDNEYELAIAQQETGDFAHAREHIQNLLAHDNNASLHRQLGDLDEESGDSVDAVNEYELTVRLDPSEQSYFKWGSELLLHRAARPAVEVFERGAAAHPKSARMLAALSAALFATGQYDEAAQRLCNASDLNPEDSKPYIFLGKIDAASSAPLACVEPTLLRFVQQQPDNADANYYYAMAVWKQNKSTNDPGELQKVETLLTKATALDPNFADAYLQLGILRFVEHQYAEAIRLYKKAIIINPQLSEAHYRLGVAYGRTGEPAKAKQEFQLHEEIEKQQAAAIERQRREIRQFLIVLNSPPPASSSNH